MSQISPPLRILLVLVLAFLAVWTLFLRPGGGAEEPTVSVPVTAPAVEAGGEVATTGPGSAVESANTAAAAPATGTVAPGTPAPVAQPGTATGTGSTSAAGEVAPVELDREALANLPVDVARAVRRDKVIALLFWDSRAAEDRRVHRQLLSLDRHRGKVMVKTAKINQISRYAPITRGVDVQQSPTVVVVDRKLKAESLVGYVDRLTIRQAVSDALRAGRR